MTAWLVLRRPVLSSLRWLYRRSDVLVGAALLAGALAAPFYQGPALARAMLGGHPARPGTVLAVLCVALALAARSLLRRDFVWLHPAELTWADLDRLRHKRIGRRLWLGFLARYAVVAYLLLAGGEVLGWAGGWVPLAVALFASGALLALTAARRPAGPAARRLEQVLPLAFALLGVLFAIASPAARVLWPVPVLAVLGALVFAVTEGPPGRPRVATEARRAELVSRWRARVARRVAVGFLDLLALLPAASGRPWRGLFGGRAVALRFAVSGAVSRSAALGLWLLVGVGVAILHAVLPRVDPLWWIGLGGYLAVLPFAAPLSELSRQPGLRRWLGSTDQELRWAVALVTGVLAVVWLGVVAALGVPVPVPAVPALLVVTGAVVRTATRPALDYDRVGLAVTPDGNAIPFGLLVQLARGPEALVVGLVLLSTGVSGGFGVGVAVLIGLACVFGGRGA